MRMWMVDPKIMCREHLLGEHVELHMFVGSILKGVSMKGYAENGLIDVTKLHSRHDELVAEMERRGYNHQSPLKDFKPELIEDKVWEARVDEKESLKELITRCPQCLERYQQNQEKL